MHGSSISVVHFEQSAHHGSTWYVSAGQMVFVVRGGVEPPTFRSSEALLPLQPPKPQIEPSQRILELVADRDKDMEAAG